MIGINQAARTASAPPPRTGPIDAAARSAHHRLRSPLSIRVIALSLPARAAGFFLGTAAGSSREPSTAGKPLSGLGDDYFLELLEAAIVNEVENVLRRGWTLLSVAAPGYQKFPNLSNSREGSGTCARLSCL